MRQEKRVESPKNICILGSDLFRQREPMYEQVVCLWGQPVLVEKNKIKHPTITSLHLVTSHPLVKITKEVNKQDNTHSFFFYLLFSFYVKDSLLSVIVNLLLNDILLFKKI